LITTGLLRALRNEHELASVMGQLVADSESLVGVAAAYRARADRLNPVLQVFELQAAGALEAVVEEYLIEVPEDHTEQAVYDGRDRLLGTASDRYVEIMRGTVEALRATEPRQREYAARRGAMLVRAAGWTPVNVDAAFAGTVSAEEAAPAAAPRANPGSRWTRLQKELDRLGAPAEPPARPRAGTAKSTAKPAPKPAAKSTPKPTPKPTPKSSIAG
jgi:hypothetical protein